MQEVMTLTEARANLAPFMPVLTGALKLAVQNWNDRPPMEHQILDEIARGVIIGQHWYEFVNRLLDDEPRVQFHHISGQRFFCVDETIILRIKHVNRYNISRNYPTSRALRWNRQLPLMGVPASTRLEFAYKMDLTGTVVDRACILLRFSNAILWMWQVWGMRDDTFAQTSDQVSKDLFDRGIFAYDDYSLAGQPHDN